MKRTTQGGLISSKSDKIYFAKRLNQFNHKKARKYNMHNDDVNGDVVRPSHGTTPSAGKTNNL